VRYRPEEESFGASRWLQVVLGVPHADAAALVSTEAAEWASDMLLACCGQTPRAINATPNRAGQLTVVSQIEQPGAATGFS
jgi:hypothetical protein